MKTYKVNQIIDESKFNRFHFLILFLCSFLIVCDGYDVVVYGSVVPSLMKEWKISPVQAGAIGSYTLFGMMVGALFFGSLADKIGRKRVIIGCISVFSLFMIMAGFATSPSEFGAYRLLAGIGLGGLMPNLVALMTEYSPHSIRSTLVSIMFNGYAIGGALSAFISIALLSSFGWKSVFLAGALPLLLIPIIVKYLPETPSHYYLRNRHEELRKILNKINPGLNIQPGDRLEMEEVKKTGMPILQLFKEKRAFSTIMFWITFFLSLIIIYGFQTWLPKLMVNAGYPLGSSIWFLVIFNLGTTVGIVVGGMLADRIGSRKVLIAYFLIGGLSVLLIGVKTTIILLYLIVFIAGATTSGSQMIANSYVSQYYPTHIRSTGVGAALGIGRIGGIIGPTLGGILLSMHVSLQVNFIVFAIPGFIASMAISLIQDKYSHRATINSKEEVKPVIAH